MANCKHKIVILFDLIYTKKYFVLILFLYHIISVDVYYHNGLPILCSSRNAQSCGKSKKKTVEAFSVWCSTDFDGCHFNLRSL